jgi:hypothetical protein
MKEYESINDKPIEERIRIGKIREKQEASEFTAKYGVELKPASRHEDIHKGIDQHAVTGKEIQQKGRDGSRPDIGMEVIRYLQQESINPDEFASLLNKRTWGRELKCKAELYSVRIKGDIYCYQTKILKDRMAKVVADWKASGKRIASGQPYQHEYGELRWFYDKRDCYWKMICYLYPNLIEEYKP